MIILVFHNNIKHHIIIIKGLGKYYKEEELKQNEIK